MHLRTTPPSTGLRAPRLFGLLVLTGTLAFNCEAAEPTAAPAAPAAPAKDTQALPVPAAPAPDAKAAAMPVAPVPAPPKVESKAFALMDYHSGQFLAEENGNLRLEPASLTKIMTVYVVASELSQGHVHMDDKVTVSEKAWRMSGSRTFIEVGKTIPLKDLLMGVIIQSGNDASVALAEHISGGEEVFVEVMNQHAARLGLNDTHFMNATGLPDPEHYSTARDLANLGAAVLRDFPDVYALFKVKEFTFNGIKQHNRNKLLAKDESVDGLKTGHTEGAGYCLVASAERQGMRLVSVILGALSEKQRTVFTQGLLNYGFRFFESHKLYNANQSLAQIRIWKGTSMHADVGSLYDFYVTVPRNQYKDLAATMDLDQSLTAPVERGQKGGVVKFKLSGKDYGERPLYILQPVAKGGYIRQWIDDAWLWIQ
jgi:D-alanyl-D-alanine carboxypeptidase (penicillin-binding protein 5/6)